MLLEKAEKLFETGKARQAKECIGELLDFLDEYTKEHFADEEEYMLSINYPEYSAQKAAYEDFIKRLAKLRSDYNTSGRSLLVILNANQMVVDWLINHISNMDKKIGQFAANKH